MISVISRLAESTGRRSTDHCCCCSSHLLQAYHVDALTGMSAGVSNHANDEAAAAVAAPAFVRPSAALLDSLRTHAAPASPASLGAPAVPLLASISLSASSSTRSKEFQIAIPRHQIRNGRTVYELRCTEVMDAEAAAAGLVGLTDVVFHRFDDFAQLHDKVRNAI